MNAKKNTAEVNRALVRFKNLLRRWYGLLSIEEIVANRELSHEIGRLERMIAQTGV